MEPVWVEQSRFDEGHDIVEAKWVPNGRHVVIVRYAAPLAETDDEDEVKRVVQVCDVEDRATLWSRVCGRSSPAASPDGRFLAHEDRGLHVLVRDIVTAKVIREVDYSRFGGRIHQITWNQTSTQIAVEFIDASIKTHIVDTRSGQELMRSSSGRFLGWGPKGEYLAFRYSDEVVVVDANSFRVVDRTSGEWSQFSWSPDGRLALISDYEAQEIHVVNLGYLHASFSTSLKAGFTQWSPDSSQVLICQSETVSSREPRTYCVLNVTTGEVSQLLESTGPDDGSGKFGTLGMNWSPDSRRVSLVEYSHIVDSETFESRDRVVLLDPRGKGPYEVIPDSMAFSWSPDGDQGMACSWNEGKHRGTVRRVDDSKPLLVIEGSSHEVWHVDVMTESSNYATVHSPCLLFAIQDVGRTCLELWDPWKGCRIGSVPFTPDEEGHQQHSDFTTVVWSPDGTRLLIQRTAQRAEIWAAHQVVDDDGRVLEAHHRQSDGSVVRVYFREDEDDNEPGVVVFPDN